MTYSCVNCAKEYDKKGSLSKHYECYPEHKPESWDVCPECDERYYSMGTHWSHNPDHRPSLTDHQKEIITGSLMSDGCINRTSKSPLLQIVMISPNYLEYIDNEFGILSTGVSLSQTAEESAMESRENGFRPNADGENYHDLYILRTRCLPELQEFADWYETGEKVWPSTDIDLTPTVLKHLYIGDGNFHDNAIRISMNNERDRIDDVKGMFRRKGFDPMNVDIQDMKAGGKKVDMYFSKQTSDEMFEYMNGPLPDFEYKFPNSRNGV